MVAKKTRTQTRVDVQPAAYVVPRSVIITMVLTLILALLFVRPYFGPIMFSALVAYIFNPVYQATLRRTNRQSFAIFATFGAAILSVILPLSIVTAVTINEATALVEKFSSGGSTNSAQLESTLERGTDRVNDLLRAFPGGESFTIDKEKLTENVKNLASDFAQGLIDFIKTASGAFFGFISTFILSIFLIIGMLRFQDRLVELIRTASPFHESMTNLYLERAGAMTKAMVKGQLIIAVSQGFASSFSLWIMGIDYFWFFFVTLSFLSFIPLGAGIITIPIGVVFILTGNIAQGVFIILYHVFVVSNIDNLLRPLLVPKNVRLNSALILLAVFSGIALFGGLGVVYGPVIMILLITSFQMYIEYIKSVKKILPPTGTS